jgi:hypothetical protein
MIDYEGRHPLSPEPVFVYIAPPPSPDLDPKGAGRVVDAMRRELGSRRRERVARVDLLPAAESAATTAKVSTTKDSSANLGLHGIDEVITCLKAAIAASLEARTSAYGEVVRQHMTALQAARPDVCFSDLFLLKDSLAVMMEAAGLVEDSVREYLELEVAFQQVEQTKRQQHLVATVQQQPPPPQGNSLLKSTNGTPIEQQQTTTSSPIPTPLDAKQLEFLNGGLHARKGIDEAAGIWSGWRATRLSVQGIAFSLDGTTLESSFGSGTSVPTAHTVNSGDTTSLLALREAVFACQSRILFKLHRYSEVLHRGLSFFHSSFSILAAHEELHSTSPKFFKESWTFAGCVSLAAAVAGGLSPPLPSQTQNGKPDGSNATSISRYYLEGVLEEGEDTSEIVDWRLGLPVTNLQDILFNNTSSGGGGGGGGGDSFFQNSVATTGATASSMKSMYCLLGQLYCTARAQLETLGASQGLHPPEFTGSVASSVAAIDAAVGTTRLASPSTSSPGHFEEGSTSPRRTLHKLRSLSPSRASVDMGSMRHSLVSPVGGASASISGGGGEYSHLGGGGGNGVDSGDEASSLSIRIRNHQDSPFDDVQENMQNVDLAAENGSGGGGDDAQIEIQNNSNTMSGHISDHNVMQATADVPAPPSSQPPPQQPREPLGPMAAAAAATAAMNTTTTTTPKTTTHNQASELTSAQISADAAEKGVELMPVASLSSFPSVMLTPVSPSSSPLAAGLASSQQQHRRTNTGTDSGLSTPRTSSAAGVGAGVVEGAASSGIATTTADAATSTTSTTQDAGVALRKIERILDDLWAPLLDKTNNKSPSLAGSSVATATDNTSGSKDTENKNTIWEPVHWRLRRALASPAAFADLWQALTIAAAVCFEHGGRQRQAVQCRSEIADCLAVKGQLAEAARLYEAQCRIALAEGWTLAAAAHLPKLAACQSALQSSGLPHTAAAWLKFAATSSIDSDVAISTTNAAEAVNLLCKAAALPSAALPLPPPLLPPRQHMPGPGAAGTLPFINSIDNGIVDLSSVLAAQPIKGKYSKFYCRNDATTGRPILCSTGASSTAPPNATSTTTAITTHVQCAVGDVNVISLQVYSRLPTSLALQDVRLLLVGMQEMTALASPRAGSPNFRPSMQNMPLASVANSIQQGGSGNASTTHQQVPTPSTAMTMRIGGGGSGGGVSPFYRTDSFADEGPRFTTEWQDTEDLQCCLVSISYSDNEEEKEKETKKASALLTPLVGKVEVRPGLNILRFMAAPVKRGIYRPVRMTAALHNLEICLDVEENSSLSTTLTAAGGAIRDQGHFLSFLEDSAAYPVVLEVESTVPRISIAPVAATGTGSLIAGQKQWIGLHVVPGRDVLENATLAVTWPVPPSEIARKMSGMLSHSAASTGGILGNSGSGGGNGGGALSPELSFSDGGGASAAVLLPQHNAALVTTTSTASTKAAYVVVEASSEIHQDGHQEISLPDESTFNLNSTDSIHGGRMTIWWWIEAGSFASPSEQVKVLAPGQTQQQQLQQLADGGIDSAPAQTIHALRSSSPHLLLHVPLYLQYLSGCRRTFSKVVPLSIHHPFTVTTAARELPNGSIVTTFNVSSLLPHTVTVTATSLALQPGLHLLRDVATELNIFPLVVLPHSVFSLSFILTVDRTMAAGDRAAAQARLQQAAKMKPTSLQVSYTVGIEESCDALVAVGNSTGEEISIAAGGGGISGALCSARSGAFTGHRTTVHGDQQQQQQQQHVTTDPLHLPSTASLLELDKTLLGTTTASSSASPFTTSALQHQQKQYQQQCRYQECSFIHHCALELSPLESDIPGAVVLVQLLGPFSATAGQPFSLCWRLERAGAAASSIQSSSSTPALQSTSFSAEPLKIQFEIGAAGDAGSWRPLGRRSGAVILEPYDGAIATIEATWVPLVAGTVAAPSLRLADVAYQECYEVGVGSTNYLVIAPSPY